MELSFFLIILKDYFYTSSFPEINGLKFPSATSLKYFGKQYKLSK